MDNNSGEIHILYNGDLDVSNGEHFLHGRTPIALELLFFFFFCLNRFFFSACISTPQLNSMHVETNESITASHFRKHVPIYSNTSQ